MTTLNSLLKGELTWLAHNSNLSVLKLDGIEYKDLRFPNEESYRGGWKESKVRPAPPLPAAHPPPPPRRNRLLDLLTQPEGEGCYTWADGSTYEGAWHAGLKHGWGKYRWPNQACYLGEWRDGFMQVCARLSLPVGSRFELKGAAWRCRVPPCVLLGPCCLEHPSLPVSPSRQQFAPAADMTHSWVAKRPSPLLLLLLLLSLLLVPQGYGTFESPDGARYSGNWQANLKHGIGKKVYGNGDSYEGLWRNGKAEGPGRWAAVMHSHAATLTGLCGLSGCGAAALSATTAVKLAVVCRL